MRRLSTHLVTAAVALLIAGLCGKADGQPAPGQPGADQRAAEAKQRYESGMAHFQLEEWDQAIEEWQAGFRAKPVPQFLYNIAQAYRVSKRNEKARTFYQKYLLMDPKAPNRPEVERHIEALTRLIEQEKRMQGAPPQQPMAVKPPPPKPGETPTTAQGEPSPAPTVVQQAPSPAPVVVVQKEPEKPTPITKKKWFWPVIGAAAVVVVGAVVIGAVVGASGGGDKTPVLPLARF
jgi:tetratricopeptide (TPR) repeat protein